MTIIDIAVICHQANKALCQQTGDRSQKDWAAAEEWQRASAIEGVRFAIKNPDAPASAQHDAWLNDKRSEGWVYGEVKNADKKTHPCIVAYDELPPEQQAKDHLFKAVVSALAPFLTS